MANIQKNIDRLMKRNNINKYTDLLRMIAVELGEKDSYKFIEKQKANFSKMLNGERPLAYDFIIPLEKILNTTLEELTCKNPFEFSKNNPANFSPKGIKYCAYIDNPKLYKELAKEASNDGRHIIENTDEYNLSLLDYLVKYKSINGFNFLVKEFGLTYRPDGLFFYIKKDGSSVFAPTTNFLGLAIGIADFDNAELFSIIFNPYKLMYMYMYEGEPYSSVFRKEEFLDTVLNKDHVFKSLFKTEKLEIYQYGHAIKNKNGFKEYGKFINPILNIVLDYTLKNISCYKKQAMQIIEYGIANNKEIVASVDGGFNIEKTGFIKRHSDYSTSGCVLISNYKTTGNTEIDGLIGKLNKEVNYEIKTNY